MLAYVNTYCCVSSDVPHVKSELLWPQLDPVNSLLHLLTVENEQTDF